MSNIIETAYPRFKSRPSKKELNEIYTPSIDEICFCEHNTRSIASKVHLMIMLKTLQRLGYFVPVKEVPKTIVNHIISCTSLGFEKLTFTDLKSITNRSRQMELARTYLGIDPFDAKAKNLTHEFALKASSFKDDLPDIINIILEELIREKIELPAFSTLEKVAKKARVKANRAYHQIIFEGLNPEGRAAIDSLMLKDEIASKSLWDRVKQEPKSPTVKNMKELADQIKWLKTFKAEEEIFRVVPDIKLRQLTAEARSMNGARIRKVASPKRYALAASLIRSRISQANDDVAEMLIKRVQKLHNMAREDLKEYQLKHIDEAHDLVATLRDIVAAYNEKDEPLVKAMLGDKPEEIVEKCDTFNAYADDNYLPFLPKRYRGCRSALFSLLSHLDLMSTNSDKSIEEAAKYLKNLQKIRSTRFNIPKNIENKWINDKWWKLITGCSSRSKAKQFSRKYFELCLFTQIIADLKSGDLCVIGGDKFSDYRSQLLSWKEYKSQIKVYCKQAELPITPKAIINDLKKKLRQKAAEVDRCFPNNQSLRFEGNEIVLTKYKKKKLPTGFNKINQQLNDRMNPVNILDILTDTNAWLGWTDAFGPLSGHGSKIQHPSERYIATTFCYGCNLGPTQTARSLKNLDRKQITFINQSHISQEKIDDAINVVINTYNKYVLPKFWGHGETASADGTKWDLYEKNLLSEFHIRYGGYGGIGYYHVSDNYIALFSHFIPCGVWEAVHILDGLVENQSDIRPNTVYGDTQGQSGPVFGLAYLLGINLMPRIRNWQDLKFFRIDKDTKYKNIDSLFSDPIDWELIDTHLEDMLRIVLSIYCGKVTPSTILRRLGNYSRKNRLYFAFRELGRVIRTIFLLDYISNMDLRQTITAATNKSEAFNGFTKWVGFGGHGVITENSREEQRKFIKYNHLISSLIILYTVNSMTHVLNELTLEGVKIDSEILAKLSPYRTHYINRFGDYFMRLLDCTNSMQLTLPGFETEVA